MNIYLFLLLRSNNRCPITVCETHLLCSCRITALAALELEKKTRGIHERKNFERKTREARKENGKMLVSSLVV